MTAHIDWWAALNLAAAVLVVGWVVSTVPDFMWAVGL